MGVGGQRQRVVWVERGCGFRARESLDSTPQQGTVASEFKAERARRKKVNNFAAKNELSSVEDVTDMALLEIDR